MGYLPRIIPDKFTVETRLTHVQPIPEGTGYSPTLGDFSSPNFDHRSSYQKEERKPHEAEDANVIFGISDLKSADELFFGVDEPDFDAEAPEFLGVEDFDFSTAMFESAMKAKERNALDNSEFGLPRLRKYPLNDRKHVSQAIRMFHHVKIESDRKELAANIVKKYDEFKMTTKVGKNNPLYKYVPDRMKMESVNEGVELTVYGFEKPHDKRSRKDIMMEHLRMNDVLFNNLFYTDDYAKAIKKINEKHYGYLQYFYPSFKIHNEITRIKTSIGGILSSLKEEEDDYRNLLLSDDNELQLYCDTHYSADANWYRTDKVDVTHISWCLKLYDLIYKLIHVGYTPDNNDNILMLEWLSNVEYHYAQMKEAIEYSEEFFQHAQYLHDMFWDPLDNPEDPSICGANIISFMMQMRPGSTGRIDEAGDMIKKQDVLGYLAKEIQLDDDVYLLPASCQYPVIDAASVRLAMDCIRRVPEEDIQEYTENLNRKYLELSCSFEISADHPYAKYATPLMKCVQHILTESDGNPKDDRLPDTYRIAQELYYNNSGIYYI